MKINLNFEDFKLNIPQQLSIKGGVENDAFDTYSKCTNGDHGCCDNSHVDDEAELKWDDEGIPYLDFRYH